MLLLSLLLTSGGCTTAWFAQFVKPDEKIPINGAAFLKTHMKDGGVYVFRQWAIDQKQRTIAGDAMAYDAYRRPSEPGRVVLNFDDISLLETSEPRQFVRTELIVLGVITGVSLAVTALCLSDTKSCFGSCPTFFAHDGTRQKMMAEGFSSAVAANLEETDIDSLDGVVVGDGPFELRMTNEALETHLVRSLRVLAVPRAPGTRVYRDGDRFFEATYEAPPLRCASGDTDCTAIVSETDDRYYLSLADPDDLATRETIELEFPARTGPSGLVITARNSLLNTFLFYQAWAYMGSQVGEWIHQLENSGERGTELMRAIGSVLGGVEVSVWTGDEWRRAGEYFEVGPLASEVQVVPLGSDFPAGNVKVRLELTRGNWKLDRLALASLSPARKAKPVPVNRVTDKAGADDARALARLHNPDELLVTYPGDAYTLFFDLPKGEHELFLESRGYYYEWMRKQWLAEEDADALALLLVDPQSALRRLAPAYKAIEADMEAIFWKSRIQELK